jgi:predicted phage terminase large subunit-like protein
LVPVLPTRRSTREVRHGKASWDCAFKDAKTSDFVAGQLWGRRDAHFYLPDQTHGRFYFPATLSAIRNLNSRSPYAVNAILVEDKANGSAVVATLKREVPGLLAVNPEGGKESRAAAVAPLIEAGNVLLPMSDEPPWIEDSLLEFVMFPAAKHDDRVDATERVNWPCRTLRGQRQAVLGVDKRSGRLGTLRLIEPTAVSRGVMYSEAIPDFGGLNNPAKAVIGNKKVNACPSANRIRGY